MPKFKLDADLLNKVSRADGLRIQTKRNQRRAKKENRAPKWFRRMQKRSERFGKAG